MRNVNNDRCLSNISRKSMLANKKRNAILFVAIVLTTVMLTTLFTVGSSVVKSIEISTTYQVGTSAHAGFKFLNQEQYDELATDKEINDLSYNILAGELLNEELREDYTEIRYTEAEAAKQGYSYPEVGKLPEKYDEIATCTQVLDDFGVPHETGQVIHLRITNGISEYECDFTVCGIWEKPAETMINEIYVSKAFQEDFSPVWKDAADAEKHLKINSFAGSINPGFNFNSSFNISGRMDELKERHGFGDDVNDGINWAYSTSSIDFNSVMIVLILLIIILMSGYLIIHNIFLIAVSSDIHYYGLLKTIGTTNRQLKRIVLKQAALLSAAAIPAGLLAGYVTSYMVLPFVVANMSILECRIIPNPLVFLGCAVFAWITVRVSCIRPCRFIKKISPVEAVRFTDVSVRKLSKRRKTKKVTPRLMAWENLKRSRRKTAAVVLSMALSVIMLNVTVSAVESFDQEKYISVFVSNDFVVCDASILNSNLNYTETEGVSFEDMSALENTPGITDAGAVYMKESRQSLEGESWERLKRMYEEHSDWFILNEAQKEWYDEMVYNEKCLMSHLYGVDRMAFEKLNMDTKAVDWDEFCSGDYAIVSAPVEGTGHDSDYAMYRVGEKIKVEISDGEVKEYEVAAIGDLSYSMGPMHGHGIDINVIIPTDEYLSVIPETKGALKYCFDVEDDIIPSAEAYVKEYCDNGNVMLDYRSRDTYLNDFKNTVKTYLIIGGALSLIVGLIGILNFINLTFTSINERKQELRILESIGMTKRQIKSMLSFEGIYRAAFTFAFVLTLGQILNYVIVQLIAGQTIMFSYRYVIWPVIACIPAFMLIAVIIPQKIFSKKDLANYR